MAEGEALLGISLVRAFGESLDAGLATLDTAERLIPSNRYDLHAERLRQNRAKRRATVRQDSRPEGVRAARDLPDPVSLRDVDLFGA